MSAGLIIHSVKEKNLFQLINYYQLKLPDNKDSIKKKIKKPKQEKQLTILKQE